MLIAFLNVHGIIHKKFIPIATIVNFQYYLGVMDRLGKRIQRVRPQQWKKKDFFLLHDNAPAHMAAVVVQFLAKKHVPVLNHLSYSSNLVPSDFFVP